mmetsp:Transcript_29951/g.26513  ORF Transcript_29951/g.26513 Transcript_29951/m.26513 type:complete len:137 (+) Transcript_29951:530-940(+)
MHLKNEDLALSDIKFGEMPSELAKQFSNVGGYSSTVKSQQENTPIYKEVNEGFRADEIMSNLTITKFPSHGPELSVPNTRFKPPINAKMSSSQSIRINRPPGSPMKMMKKKIKIKKRSTFGSQSIEMSESGSHIQN